MCNGAQGTLGSYPCNCTMECATYSWCSSCCCRCSRWKYCNSQSQYLLLPLKRGTTDQHIESQGSEISPRTHFLVAKLFQDAGFPAGVVNYIQHDPKDASACFETMISQSAVQKCNFTGSTAVGRHVAQRAGFYLKPVTLELGGKNFAIVTADADLEKAADEVLLGAFLNVSWVELRNYVL